MKKMNPGKGTGNKGFIYEVKICGLMGLRLCLDKNIEDFEIKMNEPNIKIFDDVIIKYKFVSQEQPNWIYIQLKHKLNDSYSIQNQALYNSATGDFSLLKYFNAFVEITEPEKSNQTMENKNQMFVLYTNAKINPEKCKGLQESEDSPFYKDLLSTRSDGKIYNFNWDVDENISEGTRNDHRKDFSEKFLFFSNQNNATSLDRLLEDCIQTFLNSQCHQSKLKESVSKYLYFIEWTSSKKKHKFTKSDIINNIVWCYVDSLHIEVNKPNVDADIIENWKNLERGKRLILINKYNSDYVNIIKQSIVEENSNGYNSNNYKRFLHLYFNNVENIEYFDQAWKTIECETVFFETEDHIDVTGQTFLRKTLEVLKNTNGRKLILICNGDKELTKLLSDKSIKDLPKFISLADIHSDSFIMEKKIIYYGKDVSLSDVVNKKGVLKGVFKTHDLIDILLSKFEVGISYPNLPEYYIDRKMKVSNISLNAISDECCDNDSIICLSGNYRKCIQTENRYVIHYQETVNMICLDNFKIILLPEDSKGTLEIFLQLQEKYTEYKFVLFHAEDINKNKTVLRLITTVTPGLKKYLYDDCFALNETNIKGRTIILTGDAGIGKTTYCNYLQNKSFIPSLLINHNDLLQKNCKLKDIFDSFKTGKSSVTTKIFNINCETKNLLLIIDGFDEISYSSRKNVLQLIEECVSNNYSLLITTRPVTAKILEEKLNIVSYKLEPFSKEEQSLFFRNYSLISLNLSTDSDRARQFAEKLLQIVESSINDNERSFTSIPLQCMMLADIFSSHFEEYVKGSVSLENILPTKLNLLEMYRKFVDKKINIYCKNKMMFTKAADEIHREEIKKTHIDFYKKCGIAVIFNSYKNILNRLNDLLKDYEKFYESAPKVGIIAVFQEKIEKDSSVHIPFFIHKTYAEYFAGLFLADNWKNEPILTESIFNSRNSRNFNTVRYFFDLIMCEESPLLSAVLRNDISEVKRNLEDVNIRDKGGRTAMHVAASWGTVYDDDQFNIVTQNLSDRYPKHEKYNLTLCYNDDSYEKQCIHNNNKIICKLLLKNGVNVNIKDEIKQWIPIQYADSTWSLQVLNELINKHVTDSMIPNVLSHLSSYSKEFLFYSVTNNLANIIEFFTIKQQNTSCNIYALLRTPKKKIAFSRRCFKEDLIIYGESLLHIAAKSNQIYTINFLLRERIDVNTRNYNEDTPLHTAVSSTDCIQTVNLLIDKGADINAVNKKGNTPLHNAVSKGHLNAVKALLAKVTNVDCQNNDKQTSLHLAAKKGYGAIVLLLLINGADSDITSKHDYSPLHFAALEGHRLALQHLLENATREKINRKDRHGNTPLHLAFKRKHFEIIWLLMNSGADIFLPDKHGNYPLHYAAQQGHDGIVKKLLSKSNQKSINCRNDCGQTPLHLAVENGNVSIIETFINAGAFVDIADIRNDTPLHKAASKGHVKVVEYLLNMHIVDDINCKNKYEKSPLHLASIEGHVDVVYTLITNKAEVNVVDIENNTPLHYAAMRGHCNVVTCLLGVKEIDCVSSKNKNGKTPLHLAAEKGHINIVSILLKNNVDIHTVDKNELMAIHFASKRGHAGMVCLLLDNCASVNATDSSGYTALHYAVANGHNDVALRLLDNPSLNDINFSKDEDGSTPLHLAALKGHVDIVRTLINYGADINVTDFNGSSVLHKAAKGGCHKTMKFLLAHMSPEEINRKNNTEATPLHIAAEEGHLDVVTTLKEHGANVNVADAKGNSPLYYATVRSHKKVIKSLLRNLTFSGVNSKYERGATQLHLAALEGRFCVVRSLLSCRADVTVKDDEGNTALNYAVFGGYNKIVNYLLENQKNECINYRNNASLTPLHLAAQKGYTNIVRTLARRGADINATDDEGYTPLHYAAMKGYDEIVRYLLRLQQDVNIKNENEATPLHLAAGEGYIEVVQVLIDYEADVNATDITDSTPLHYATLQKRSELVDYVLKINYNDDEKYSDSTSSNLISRKYDWVVRNLLFKNADVNAIDFNGNTPLHNAALREDERVVSCLLQKFNNVNCKNENESTPLHLACHHGNTKMLRLLLFFRASIDISDIEGNTPFHIASLQGQTNILTCLLRSSADFNINSKNNLGATPLHLAVLNGHIEVCHQLLKHGASINIADLKENIPLHIAASHGHENIVMILVQNHKLKNINSKNENAATPLHLAALGGHCDIVQMLIIFGAEVNVIDARGNTPLHNAALQGHSDVVKCLLESKAIQDVHCRNVFGVTPLNMAIQKEYTDVIELLLAFDTRSNIEKSKQCHQK